VIDTKNAGRQIRVEEQSSCFWWKEAGTGVTGHHESGQPFVVVRLILMSRRPSFDFCHEIGNATDVFKGR
jgi:hypothetical protein